MKSSRSLEFCALKHLMLGKPQMLIALKKHTRKGSCVSLFLHSTKIFVEHKIPFNIQRTQSEEFPKLALGSGMPHDKQLFFERQQQQHKEWVQRPLNFDRRSINDLLELRKTRVFRAGTGVRQSFGNESHTAWNTFEKSVISG